MGVLTNTEARQKLASLLEMARYEGANRGVPVRDGKISMCSSSPGDTLPSRERRAKDEE